jgi:hypothetical protein
MEGIVTARWPSRTTDDLSTWLASSTPDSAINQSYMMHTTISLIIKSTNTFIVVAGPRLSYAGNNVTVTTTIHHQTTEDHPQHQHGVHTSKYLTFVHFTSQSYRLISTPSAGVGLRHYICFSGWR